MSEEIQRIIGTLTAQMASVEKRLTRLEGWIWKVGAGAIGLIIMYLLKQAGLV